MRYLAAFIGLFILLSSSAQSVVLRCGNTDEPRQEIEDLIQAGLSEAQNYRGGGGGCEMLFIPVVFHVIADPNIPASNITDQRILLQLDALNQDFNNPQNNNPVTGGNPCITFCLAQNTFDGRPWAEFGGTMAGITRWSDADISDYDPADDAINLANLIHFPPEQYFNIWITDNVLDANTGGIATGPTNQFVLEGVVIEHGQITNPPTMDGRLLSHETGHYLGLWHTYQGGCGAQGDFCNDTPPQQQANFNPLAGCNDATPTTCGVPEDIDNHMDDIGDQACRTTFTVDQIERIESFFLQGLYAGLLDPANHFLTGITTLEGGCADFVLTAEIQTGSQQYCLNDQGLFEGAIPVDSWVFTFVGPNGTITVPGMNSLPTALFTFNVIGEWNITLEVTLGNQTVTSQVLTVFASECGAIDTDQCIQWYFGAFCGLDFTNGIAEAIDGSNIGLAPY